MKKLSILICFLAAFSLSYSQRKKTDQEFRRVKADTVRAAYGIFNSITGIDTTEIDNANGSGDSLVIFTDRGLKFKNIEEGYNTRFDHRGDSVLILNGTADNFSQSFYPKPGEAGYTTEGFTASTAGTVTARVQGTTNVFNSSNRVGFVSSATAGGIAYFTSVAPAIWRGNLTGRGGFYVTLRFGIPQTVSNRFSFFGMSASTISSSVAPSTLLSLIGVGTDAADATLQFIYNDTTGAATKVATSITPSTTSIYELTLYALPFSSSVTITLKDISQGLTATNIATTNIPVNTQFLKPILYMSNNTTAASVAFDVLKIYAESKF